MKKAKKWIFWIFIIIVLPVMGVTYYISYAINQHYFNPRRAEGLVLASSYKNMVTDNIVNEKRDLSEGASEFKATRNTESITVNGQTGIITIKASQRGGNVVLYLTPGFGNPFDETFNPYKMGDDLSKPLTWRCSTQNEKDFEHVPAECRNILHVVNLVGHDL